MAVPVSYYIVIGIYNNDEKTSKITFFVLCTIP